MSPTDHPEPDEALSLPEDDELAGGAGEETEEVEADGGEEEKIPLHQQVDIQTRSTCERHVVVTIPPEDIAAYYDREFSELVKDAKVPGFRPGRTPRKLIETRFRKEIKDQVKTKLLMASMEQVSEANELTPISEPELKLEAVELPDDGPMTYEFDLEVRPEFDVPNWRGLVIERPVREFSEEDVTRAVKNLLAQHGKLVPFDGPAERGDYISTKLTFTFEGNELAKSEDELIRIRPVLSFRDGKIDKFDELMVGVRAGETRVGQAQLTDDAPNADLRGKAVTATFEVKEVKKLELPELSHEFLHALGDFASEAELRDAVRDALEGQLEYQQHRRAREQITRELTASANWELPPRLLQRQAQRELERSVLELRRAQFTEDQIRAHENVLRRNSMRSTAQALKEHFILERIAEIEAIEVEESDYDAEIHYIAQQSGESARRIRARLEKAGRMDVLTNQVVERKVIEKILAEAQFTDAPYQPDELEEEALDRTAGGEPEKPAESAPAAATVEAPAGESA